MFSSSRILRARGRHLSDARGLLPIAACPPFVHSSSVINPNVPMMRQPIRANAIGRGPFTMLGQRREIHQEKGGHKAEGKDSTIFKPFDIFSLREYPPHTPEAATHLTEKLREIAPKADPEGFIAVWQIVTKKASQNGRVGAGSERGVEANFSSSLAAQAA